MKYIELHLFILLVVLHYPIYEKTQVIVEFLEDLYSLHLPHLFDFDVVE